MSALGSLTLVTFTTLDQLTVALLLLSHLPMEKAMAIHSSVLD